MSAKKVEEIMPIERDSFLCLYNLTLQVIASEIFCDQIGPDC